MSARSFLKNVAAIAALALLPANFALCDGLSESLPPQTLADALDTFARDTGFEVVYRAELTKAVMTRGARAGLSAEETLKELLRETGLTFEFVNEKTVAIRDGSTVSGAVRTSAAQTGDATLPADERVKVAQAEGGQILKGEDSKNEGEGKLEEVVVTGTNIRGVGPAGSPLITISKEQIDQSGRGSTQELFRTVLQNFAGGETEISGDRRSGLNRNNFAGGTAIDLRGLGTTETLVLLDGRRLAPSGQGDFVDISAIPVSALSAVDILTDGASATYGSDAIAGVVNFRLRADLQGAETRVRYGSTTGGGATEYLASHVYGSTWSSGHLIAGVQYHRRDPLFAEDRDITASEDLRPFGGMDQRITFSSPGNITSPASLAGAIPTGTGLTLTSGNILRGQSNLGNRWELTNILPDQKSYSGFVSATQNVSDRLELYAEALAAHRGIAMRTQSPTQTLSVPATNAYRIANGLGLPGTAPIAVNYFFINDLGPLRTEADSTAYSTRAGARYSITSQWQIDVYGTYGKSKEDSTTDALDTRSVVQGGALLTALASSNLATAFNPFSSGGSTNSSVLGGLLGQTLRRADSGLSSINLKADGELLDLPGGSLRLAIGGEYRRESFGTFTETRYSSGVQPGPASSFNVADVDRTASAEFAEVYLPLVSAANALPFVELADISASVRHDSYSDFGDTTNPKFGARWSPGLGLTLRGSWGTSFRAPLLYDLNNIRSIQYFQTPTAIVGHPDRTGNGVTDLLFVVGGNPTLTPEKGETWTLGLDFRPPAEQGIKLALTYYHIKIDDHIAAVTGLGAVLANSSPYEGAVFFTNPSETQISDVDATAGAVFGTRFASGVTDAIFVSSLSNISVVRTNGLDFNVEYETNTPIGRLRLAGQVSKILDFDSALTEASAPLEYFDVIGRPIGLTGRATATLSKSGWSISLIGNYKNSYTDNTLAAAPRNIDSNTTMDIYSGVQLSDAFPQLGDGWTLSASLVNVFDTDPPFTDSLGRAWDGTNYSPIGRAFGIELGKKW